ncbi:hypothetical protein AA313_de0204314 [Arthrobotrys entomopaga]|nr:hypothetical protein AA313_de0204314 [Arthrobotrys entomopaga]
MASNTVSRFEKLPTEIRHKIYRYLVDPQASQPNPGDAFAQRERSRLKDKEPSESPKLLPRSHADKTIHPSILLTNRFIYRDCHYFLYHVIGPVITVRSNFHTWLYQRLIRAEDIAVTFGKDEPGAPDVWKEIFGRDAHLQLTEGGNIQQDHVTGTIVLVGMKEIERLAGWMNILYLASSESSIDLKLRWEFNDGKKNVLGDYDHHPQEKHSEQQRAHMLDLFANLRHYTLIRHSVFTNVVLESNILNGGELPPDYAVPYLERANSPFFWHFERSTTVLRNLEAFENEAHEHFSAGRPGAAETIYSLLSDDVKYSHVLRALGRREGGTTLDIDFYGTFDPNPWRPVQRLLQVMQYNSIVTNLKHHKTNPYSEKEINYAENRRMRSWRHINAEYMRFMFDRPSDQITVRFVRQTPLAANCSFSFFEMIKYNLAWDRKKD